MNAPLWLLLLVSAVTDFTVVAGSTLTGAMLATGQATLPSQGVWLLAIVAGLVAAGKEMRSMLKLPTPQGEKP